MFKVPLTVLAFVVASVFAGSASRAARRCHGPASTSMPSCIARSARPPTWARPARRSSFDTIYEFGGVQPNVATAAPGDAGYNGGRSRVQVLAFPTGYATAVSSADANGSGNIDSDDELQTAFDAGTTSRGRRPVVRLPSHSAPA